MDSETRCNGFKFIKKTSIIIPHKSYYGDLPIEIIISDLNYLKSRSKVGYGIYKFYKILGNVINKLKDDKFCYNFISCDFCSLDEEEKKLVYMFLVILDYIERKISSSRYFIYLKKSIQEELNVRVEYSSIKKLKDL